jgi:hypothetical protein
VVLPDLVAAPEAAGNGEASSVPAADRRAHIRHTLHTRLLISVTNPPSTVSLVSTVPFPVGQSVTTKLEVSNKIASTEHYRKVVRTHGAYSDDCGFESWTRGRLSCVEVDRYFFSLHEVWFRE